MHPIFQFICNIYNSSLSTKNHYLDKKYCSLSESNSMAEFTTEISTQKIGSDSSEILAGNSLTERLPDIVIDVKEVQRCLIKFKGAISGTDSTDKIYTDIEELWRNEFKKKSQRSDKAPWYQKGFDYWESESNCPTTDNGVLGGYGFLTPIDTRESNIFLDLVLQLRPAEFSFRRAAGL